MKVKIQMIITHINPKRDKTLAVISNFLDISYPKDLKAPGNNPITTIGIREDGEGYGGAHKFEMLVAEDFGKYVESVSRDIFGDQEPIRFPDTVAADLRR